MSKARLCLLAAFTLAGCSEAEVRAELVIDEAVRLCPASLYGVDPVVALPAWAEVELRAGSESISLERVDGRTLAGTVPYALLDAALGWTVLDYRGASLEPNGAAQGVLVENWAVDAVEVEGYQSVFLEQSLELGGLRVRLGFDESSSGRLKSSEAVEFYGQFLPEGDAYFEGLDGAWPLVRCRDASAHVREDIELAGGGHVIVDRVLFNDSSSVSFSTNEVVRFEVEAAGVEPGECAQIYYSPQGFSELRYELACRLESAPVAGGGCVLALRDIALSSATPEPGDEPRLEILGCTGDLLWSDPVVEVTQVEL